jgi:hypothetical protein
MKSGQIAQSVEQGIENPRVGGSTPSLATFFLAAASLFGALAASGCGGDDCEQLCSTLTQRFADCVEEWPTDWEELDARGQTAFRNACQNRWADVRAGLEPRELNDALDQCDESATALQRMSRSSSTCDQLRALYLVD